MDCNSQPSKPQTARHSRETLEAKRGRGVGDARARNERARVTGRLKPRLVSWQIAQRYVDAGLSIIPIGAQKEPAIKWKAYQEQRPTADEVRSWWGDTRSRGFGLVCGAVSGGMEVLDFDEPGLFDRFSERVEAEAPGLIARLPHVRTPRGGDHLFLRSDARDGNQKLAETADRRTRIETRGRGGYVLLPGSPAFCHPTFRPYQLLAGSPSIGNSPRLTTDEREVLLSAARRFNEYWPQPAKLTGNSGSVNTGGNRPGDDYEARAAWAEVLEGWRVFRQRGDGVIEWTRPGKDVGCSATTGFCKSKADGKDLLKVFSSNAAPLAPNSVYSKFGAYATLHHAGNYTKAAQALAAQGYGRADSAIDVSSADWSAPTPLTSIGPLPEFAQDALPEAVRSFVAGLAESRQVPADMVAMLSLSAVAACAGGRYRARVGPDWSEPLSIYTLTVLPSGNRKSAVVDAIISPLAAWEAEQFQSVRRDVAAALALRQVLEKKRDRAIDAAARSSDPAELKEAEAAARELDSFHVPTSPRLLAEDTTPEKLVTLLANNGGRIAVLSPEGGVLDVLCGMRYGKGAPNLDPLLKAHAGDAIRVDRGTRSEFVDRPALTLGLAVQPEVLRTIRDGPGFAGRGLLARFLYSIPMSTVGHRNCRPAAMPAADSARWTRLVRHLLHNAPTPDPLGRIDAVELQLEPGAVEFVHQFAEELEPRLGAGGDLEPIAEWASKLTGAVVRIAGLLHLADCADRGERRVGSVSEESVGAAVRIGEYLIAHARAAFAAMRGDPAIGLAGLVLAAIKRIGATEISRRDLHQSLRNNSRFATPRDLEEPLRVLQNYEWIRRLPQAQAGTAGRPQSDQYAINPALWDERPT